MVKKYLNNGSNVFHDDANGNWIIGLAGNDTIFGNGGHDILNGGLGRDYLDGGRGDDLLIGGFGDDRLFGGTGKDKLKGGAGADTLAGQAGDDRLEGGDGNDKLDGGDYQDVLLGGSGSDILNGGTYADKLYGGADFDTFVFKDGDGYDEIWDFDPNGEMIDLRGVTHGSSPIFSTGPAIDSFSDLVITHWAEGTGVYYGTGSIMLMGVDASQLSGADFIFAQGPGLALF